MNIEAYYIHAFEPHGIPTLKFWSEVTQQFLTPEEMWIMILSQLKCYVESLEEVEATKTTDPKTIASWIKELVMKCGASHVTCLNTVPMRKEKVEQVKFICTIEFMGEAQYVLVELPA